MRLGLRTLAELAKPLVLRDYKQDCVSQIIHSLDRIHKPAVSVPTGGGKTVIFTSLIPQIKPQQGQGEKTLILANRVEIVSQALNTINSLMPHKNVAVDQGPDRSGTLPNVDICVASIQTLANPDRLAAHNPKDYKLVIVDEAHHTAAQSYQTVLAHFGINKSDPKVYCLGVSATFFRNDRKSLEIFDEIVYHRMATEMIDLGHLSKVQISKYDFEIPEPYTTHKNSGNFLFCHAGLKLVVKLWKDHQPQCRSTVVFGINRNHVQTITATFRRQGIDARSVTSDDDPAHRARVIQAFKNQEFSVLVNCSILSEGTDVPCIDHIIFATPMGSPGLAMQMIGRGLRKFPGKEICNISFFKPLLKFDTTHTIMPELRGDFLVEELEKNICLEDLEDGTPDWIEETEERYEFPELNCEITDVKVEKTFNLMEIFRVNGVESPPSPRLAWSSYNGRYFLVLPRTSTAQMLMIEPHDNQYGLWLIRDSRQPRPRRLRTKESLFMSPSLDQVRITAENFIATEFFAMLCAGFFDPDAAWRPKQASDAQINVLKQCGLDKVIPHLTRGRAHTLLSIKIVGGFNLSDQMVNESMRLGLYEDNPAKEEILPA